MIKLTDVSKTYIRKKRKVKALKNVNIELEDTGLIFINGDSGSGKSTFMNLIAQEIKPTTGSISYDGEVLNLNPNQSAIFKSNNIGYIFQEYNLIEDLTISDNIKLALSLQNKTITDDEIEEKLASLGLDDVIHAHPSELSGGQKQRVTIARALLLDYKIILADEPTGALDEENSIAIFKLLKEISKEKLVLVISHNQTLVRQFAQRIITIKHGEIVSDEYLGQIANSNIDINMSLKKPKVKTKFFTKLGFKYINFKKVKFYISTILITITCISLFSFLSILTFSEKNIYNNHLKNETDSLSSVSIYSSYYSYNNGSSTKIETPDNVIRDVKEIIGENKFDYYRFDYGTEAFSLTIEDGTQYPHKYNISYIGSPNSDISLIGMELITGNMPTESGEIAITNTMLTELNLTLDNYNTKTILDQDNNPVTISGIIKSISTSSGSYNYDTVTDKEYIIHNLNSYVNDIVFSYDYYPKVTSYSEYYSIFESLDYSKCVKIKNILQPDNAYYGSFLNKTYDQFRYITEMKKYILLGSIGGGAIFLFISLLLLISIVTNNLNEKKNDIKMLNKLGCQNKTIFNIFVIEPLFIFLISLIISFIALPFVTHSLNNVFTEMFNINGLKFISVNILAIFLTLLVFALIIFASTILPIRKMKKKI